MGIRPCLCRGLMARVSAIAALPVLVAVLCVAEVTSAADHLAGRLGECGRLSGSPLPWDKRRPIVLTLMRLAGRLDSLQHRLDSWQYHNGRLSDHWQDQGENGEHGQGAVECYRRCQISVTPSVLQKRLERETTTDRASQQPARSQPPQTSASTRTTHASLNEKTAETSTLWFRAIPLVVQGLLTHKTANPTSEITSPTVIAAHLIACIAVNVMVLSALHPRLPSWNMATRLRSGSVRSPPSRSSVLLASTAPPHPD